MHATRRWFWGLALLSLFPAIAAAQGRPQGEVNTPPARGERPAERLKAGDPAPDFTLPPLNAGDPVKLSTFRGQKPVVLIFGSYT